MKIFCFIGACMGLLVASCSQTTPPEVVETPTYVGVVENVYPKYKYVIVRLSGGVPSEGDVLISQSGDDSTEQRVANLIVSAERMGNLRVPADIRSGQVEKGDLVFLYKNLAPPDTEKQEPADILGPVLPVVPVNNKPDEKTVDPLPDVPKVIPPSGGQKQSVDDYFKSIPKTLEEADRIN